MASEQTCPNRNCQFYRQKSQGNITIHSTQPRRHRCRECKKTWGERINTPYYRLRGNKKKFAIFEKLYDQGMGIREIAHAMNVSTSTIQRWESRFGF